MDAADSPLGFQLGNCGFYLCMLEAAALAWVDSALLVASQPYIADISKQRKMLVVLLCLIRMDHNKHHSVARLLRFQG